ncbi:MAG TPA: ATP-binding protein [Sphingomonas sp.]
MTDVAAILLDRTQGEDWLDRLLSVDADPAVVLESVAAALARRMDASAAGFVRVDADGLPGTLAIWQGGVGGGIVPEGLVTDQSDRIVVPLHRDGEVVAMLFVDGIAGDTEDAATVGRVAASCRRTVLHARTLARLEDSEARAGARDGHDLFLRALSDAIRDERDAGVIQSSVTGMLRAHLGVARVALIEADDRAGLSAAAWAMLSRGRTVRQVGADALVGAPILVEGALAAVLAIHDPGRRAWRDGDVRLAEELAERGWAAIGRARAEAALAERERAAQFLLDWSDAVRGVDDADAIVATTLGRIATHLRVDAAVHSRRDGGACRWFRGETRVIRRRTDGAAMGLDLAGEIMLDRVVAPVLARRGVAALLSVPLGTDDDPGVLAAVSRNPRAWTAAEAQLLHDLGERLHATLTQVRADRQRRESEALLSAFMERAPLGMHVKDAGGRYLRINPELAYALGHPGEAILGRHPAEFLAPELATRLEAIEAEARGGATASAELVDPTRDHHSAIVSVAFPIAGAGEACTGGFTIDLTERMRAEAELAQSRETLHQTEKLSALGALLAGVSHELNNPLSIVTAQADLIAHQAGDGPLAERAGKLREAAERCAKIVRTFLAMARRQEPVRRAVDLNAVATAALDLVAYGFAADGVVVTRAFEPALPRIEADPDQLHQIVVNLLVNAQHAMADCAARRVTVSTRAVDGGVELEVADSGPGVPEAVRRRLFEPFFTTKPIGQGTGMGLAFSHGLAAAHGGALELVPGQEGAVFRLSLPCGAHTPVPVKTEPGRSISRTRTALVVDDERELGEALAGLLQREGYQCRVVENGSAAQALLGTGRFDLIVSDMRMPGVDGPALYRWVQRVRPELLNRLAFATGDMGNPITTAFLMESGRPYLEKPITYAAVRDLVGVVEGR